MPRSKSTGTASGRFDGKMQQTGIIIHVTSLDGVRVLRRAASSPWDLPITPMDQMHQRLSRQQPSVSASRVHGTLTYYRPGAAAVLQEGDKSLWLITSSSTPLHIGDVADATGFLRICAMGCWRWPMSNCRTPERLCR